MKRRLLTIALLNLFTLNALASEQRGLEIAKQVDHHDRGWQDMSAKLTMTLYNRNGDKSVRYMRINTMEVQNDGDKSLTVFDQPRDIKGTAFLVFSHVLRSDYQWLYLPQLRRVKRISSVNKSGRFMGSEFAYEDLSSFEVGKYRYKYQRDEKLGDLDTYVVDMYPRYKYSGYTRLQVWIDKEHYRFIKQVFYDRKNSPLKTLTYDNYQLYLGHYWRAKLQNMINHQTGKKAEVVWKDYKFRNGFTNRDFDKNRLKRIR
jgi:outer membrane lipoprotein-sorting protein